MTLDSKPSIKKKKKKKEREREMFYPYSLFKREKVTRNYTSTAMSEVILEIGGRKRCL
jgi:hypothetical protein